MEYVWRLYIAGDSPSGMLAIENVRKVIEQRLPESVDLEIIDILEFPAKAAEDRILATPTLIKVYPPPRRKIIGDLSHSEHLILSLALQSAYDKSRFQEADDE